MPGFPKDRFNRSTRDNSGVEGAEPMDVEQNRDASRSKRLSEPFFLQKILLEKAGDTSALTTLALSVHAIMLESGFVLLDWYSDKELPSVSIKYTLPELIKISRKENKKSEYVTVIFRNLGCVVVVNGNLDGYSETGHKTYLDKRRFLSVIRLVVDFLYFEEQVSSIFYHDVFVLWRLVKDTLVLPLLIDFCEKTGLESPPYLMSLPTELKLKILEPLPGVSIGNIACVCKEMRNLASNNDLWKQKYVEECLDRYDRTLTSEVNWKNAYAQFLMYKRLPFFLQRRNFPIDTGFSQVRRSRSRILRFGGDIILVNTLRFTEENDHMHLGHRFAGR